MVGLTLVDLIRTQIDLTPDAVAVDDGTVGLTYLQLDLAAERFADLLRGVGVGRGDLVGICTSRTARMVALVVGILRVGAAYVPLDPAYPADRLQVMVDDAAMAAIVCDRHLRGALPATGADVRILHPDDAPARGAPPDARGEPPRPDDLAYVLYTSGSTGRPKGVMIEHRSAVNLACWARETYASADLRRVLLATSLAWDLSVFELFGTLAAGGTVVLVPNALALVEDSDWLDVSLVNSVPSVVARILDRGPLPDSVRVVNLAGEALHAELVHRIHALRPDVAVWNLYGPTETTTYSTGSLVERDAIGAPSIGRPIRNTYVRILAPDGTEAAPGESGELCIGGDGVARGYLGQHVLTTDRFIIDPCGSGPGRLYRTGDLARRDADGTLWFLGRTDHQVKIRGLRIELGDIDANLLRVAGVAEAVTVVKETSTGTQRLVAYVAGRAGADPEPEVVRKELEAILPPHMVPAQIVVLERLPLAPNGKIDRRALPEPDRSLPGADPSRPLDDVERQVADVFGVLLSAAPPASADQDFFDLGGDSLLAVELLVALEETTGARLRLSALLEHSTVAQVAVLVRRSLAGEVDAGAVRGGLVPLRVEGDDPPLFLGPSMVGSLRIYRDLVAHLAPGRPVHGLHAQGLDGDVEPMRTVGELADHFAEQILASGAEGPFLLGGFSFASYVAVEAARRLHAAGHPIAVVVMIDTNPFEQRPAWTEHPIERIRREAGDLRARRNGARVHRNAGTLVYRRALEAVAAARQRRRDLRSAALAPTPAPGSDPAVVTVRDLNYRAARLYRFGRMDFPVAIIEVRATSTFDAGALAHDHRAGGPVRHVVMDEPGLTHGNLLGETHARAVAANVDDAIAWALARPPEP